MYIYIYMASRCARRKTRRRDYDRAQQNLRELRDSTARARAEEVGIRMALRSAWENRDATWDTVKKEAKASNRPEPALLPWYEQQFTAEESLRAKLAAAEGRLILALDAEKQAFAETAALRNTMLREHRMKVTRVKAHT